VRSTLRKIDDRPEFSAMLKVILQLYPVIPAASEEERAALRPIGRNRERYQEALTGWHEIIKVADELKLWGVATIEHHFWSEGYECGPNPGILDAYWAAITKNVRVGQLGYVMSTQNPLRVAEETAILDHLTRGRCFVGFARGYQSRWTNVVGQHLGTRATGSPSAISADPGHLFAGEQRQKDVDDDALNRRLFEEEIDIVVKAWTQDSIEHKGEAWQIPFPFDRGVDDWPLALNGVTQRLGAPGEVGPDGSVRRISVVPAPYTRPHPPVFCATAGSPESAEYAARHAFIPLYFTSIKNAVRLGTRYHETAHSSGHPFAFGQNQAVVRMPHLGDTMEEARRSLISYDGDIFRNFYSSMGRQKIDTSDLVKATTQFGMWVPGTVDDVRRQLVDEWKQFPAEYLTLIYHYAQMPKEVVIRNLELFMREIKPALDELTPYTETPTQSAAAGR
jgi:alkanesulfonate monooxygenase SsuD/methylene tetrahydromethanopterin reductase-like flavin-dependent oxidoreductase (luciferase family)